jgi:hypothetical protein
MLAQRAVYIILACIAGGVEGWVVGHLVADRVGSWGAWSDWNYCSFGKRMPGFQIRVEGPQGSGDDTGINGFKMFCEMGDTYQVDGHWGGWYPKRSCASGFGAFEQKIEPPNPDGTGMNDILLYHADYTWAQTGCGNCGWGVWSTWSKCRSGAYICGFRLKLEEGQGGGDGTAASSAEFLCCHDCVIAFYHSFVATDACVACPVAFSLIAVPAEKPTVITKSAHCDLRFRGVRA